MAERASPAEGPGEISLARLAQEQASGLEQSILVAQMVHQMEGSQRLWRLRDVTTYTLLALFALGNLAALSLFFLNGLEVTKLTDASMGALGAATIAEVVGLLTIVVKGLFPNADD